ncbi:TonB-dependent receptor [Alsobacter metallidurans]|uniref:TonB-dependent receptor n=1 Tax=Alsobacter metallidurans TaxID=340221 RepID=A0A917MI90_9HYPH|nr:tetratricopeptide repeat protein [Alsobacter metallidurans]GGH19731.1 TonB-dependent receptor [Alsobacter metallidurans]
MLRGAVTLLGAGLVLFGDLEGANAQQPAPRQASALGSIVANKGGEELRFVREEGWRPAEVRQDLLGGDTLRTNTIGNLGILFSDQTQIRVGPRSTLVLNDIASGDKPTTVELPSGNVWARAARGGTGVVVKTPAAAATIRGTDWSLSVEGNRTSLIVLEGVVELSNPQGSVTVRQGEGAVATLGSAPTKIILVQRKEREQMLLHLNLRDAFNWMPATPLQGPALRAERTRIAATPPEWRTAEQWLTLAEVSLGRDTRQNAALALDQAKARGLSGGQRARATLVEASLAAMGRRWAEAARLFKAAETGVSGRRRVTAAYGAYIAGSLADPRKRLPEPRIDSRDGYGAMVRAFLSGFTKDLQEAARQGEAAERDHPDDPLLTAFSAQVAYALDRRDGMRARVDKLARLDPDDPLVLLTRAMLKGDVDSDLEGAQKDLERAAAEAPGDAQVWNALGLVHDARDAPLESEAAFRRAIAVDPDDPVAYANLAILLLDQSRVDEAAVLVDKALEIDPSLSAGYTAKGRVLLQRGDSKKAIEYFLAGTAANPSYGNGVLAAAVGYYMDGQVDLALQQFDAADRLDPNDPITSLFRTAIAIDQYQADDAIENARESVRRFRARGGYYSPLAVTKSGGSYMADAYRLIGLDGWARFYGDRVFDPFTASGYFDAANARTLPSIANTVPDLRNEASSADPQAMSLIMQGLLFDPLAVAGRAGRIDVIRRPFLDTEVTAGSFSRDGRTGFLSGVTVQGFSNLPFPTSFVAAANSLRTPGPRAREWDTGRSASVFVGATPTPQDHVVGFASFAAQDPRFDSRLQGPNGRQVDSAATGQVALEWSHTFSRRNVVNVAAFGGSTKTTAGATVNTEIDLFRVGFPLPAVLADVQRRRTSYGTLAVNHTIGADDFTLRYGFEGTTGRITGYETVDGRFDFFGLATVGLTGASRENASFRSGLAYADAFWRPSDRFEMQAGLYGRATTTQARGAGDVVGNTFFGSPLDRPFVDRDRRLAAPRIGFALSPIEGHWLRAAYRQDMDPPTTLTLSPVNTVGLFPQALPTSVGSRTDSAIARWDAEWTKRFFTAVEYQRQKVTDLSFDIPYSQNTLGVERARIDRVTATANLWLGYGVGVFASVGGADSEVTRGFGTGLPVPFVPERFARAGVTFVHPSRIKFTLAETVVSRRRGDLAGTRLDDFATTDATLSWETQDRHLQVGVGVFNIFDEKAERVSGVVGARRTITATATARF